MSSRCRNVRCDEAARRTPPWRGTALALVLAVSSLLGLAIACIVSAATTGEPVAPAAGARGNPAVENPAPPVLRVTADPNNLPFTNERLEGFENRIAELVARDLGMRLDYVWRAQRR